MENSRPTQVERVLKYMKDFGSITQHEALLDIGVSRLPSRITEIKKAGIPIEKDWVTVRNRYNEPCRVRRYRLGKEGVN